MATRSPALGPAEWVVLTFPGTASPAVLVPTLATLVDTGIVRLIDTAVVRKDADGTVRGAEQEDEDLDVGAVDGDVLELFQRSGPRLDRCRDRTRHDHPRVGLGEPLGRRVRRRSPARRRPRARTTGSRARPSNARSPRRAHQHRSRQGSAR